MTRDCRTTVSREGWYYLVLLAMVFGAAMLRDMNLLLVLAGMLAGPLLFGWRAARLSARGLKVHRKFPPVVSAGDLLVVHIGLENTRRRFGSWAVVVEDRLQRETDSERNSQHPEQPIRTSVLFPYVPAGESQDSAYRGRLVRRGRYRLGPMKLLTRFPFGLFCHAVTVRKTQNLTVFPRLGRLNSAWFSRHRQSLAGTHRREQRSGQEGDFYGVRTWRTGDSRRWIHWRNSARTGELVVRQFEQPQNRDVAVLLDLWQGDRPAPEHVDNVELAVSFAATVVADLCRKGGADLLVDVAGEQPRPIRGPASSALLNEVMQCLATTEARHLDYLPQLLDRTLAQVEPGTEIVLIGTRATDLGNAARFGFLSRDSNRRAMMRLIRFIDVSRDELADYFEPQ